MAHFINSVAVALCLIRPAIRITERQTGVSNQQCLLAILIEFGHAPNQRTAWSCAMRAVKRSQIDLGGFQWLGAAASADIDHAVAGLDARDQVFHAIV